MCQLSTERWAVHLITICLQSHLASGFPKWIEKGRASPQWVKTNGLESPKRSRKVLKRNVLNIWWASRDLVFLLYPWNVRRSGGSMCPPPDGFTPILPKFSGDGSGKSVGKNGKQSIIPLLNGSADFWPGTSQSGEAKKGNQGSFSSSNQKEETEQNKQARSSQRVGTTRKRIFNVMFKRIEWSSGFGGQSLVPSRGGQASWCLDHKSQTGLEQLDLCCGGPTWRGKHWTKT